MKSTDVPISILVSAISRLSLLWDTLLPFDTVVAKLLSFEMPMTLSLELFNSLDTLASFSVKLLPLTELRTELLPMVAGLLFGSAPDEVVWWRHLAA